MNGESNPQPDILNDIGQYVLKFDTRWLFLGALAFVALFWLIRKWQKDIGTTTEDLMRLALSVLQLYSAPVLFCMLVLTKPPATTLVSEVQRQSAGLLAFIFLVAGVFVQIKRVWEPNDDRPTHDFTKRPTESAERTSRGEPLIGQAETYKE